MSRARQAILPGYVLLCLLIGGSAQGMWGNAILQLGAIALLAWAALTREPQSIARAGRWLLGIVGALLILFVVQLIPLPPDLWVVLPGRAQFAEGFSMLGMPPPWLPISQSPYDTATTAMTLLPPLAVLVAMLRLRCWTAGWLLAAIVIGAAISIVLGILQITGDTDFWYFYQRTNIGTAVGAFANGNHFATLLLASVPLLAALVMGRWRSRSKAPQRASTLALAATSIAVVAIGFLINGSAAMLLIGPAVVAATALLALRPSPQSLRIGLAGTGLLLVMAAVAIVFVGRDLPGWGTEASIETRTEFWSKSLRAAGDQMPAGSGFGTFQQTYRRYEDFGAVDRWYVNHAHNDFLEIALEGGIAAVILLVVFLLWWIGRARDAWFSTSGTVEQRAASIASAAIILHSAFDYPLRTAAIAAVMAACLALLAGAVGTVRSSRDEDEPVRHTTLEGL
ncbi:MAG TPA: O-antigen ligase family protein [Sphingomicrobium sp.]|nr:O-antigen ligase family protein [Sphingomicrobium sp.]